MVELNTGKIRWKQREKMHVCVCMCESAHVCMRKKMLQRIQPHLRNDRHYLTTYEKFYVVLLKITQNTNTHTHTQVIEQVYLSICDEWHG